MATRLVTGFNTGDLGWTFGSTGTISVQSTVKRTGVYALRVNPTGTGIGYVQLGTFAANGTTGTFNATDLYFSIYFRIDTLPASGSEELCTVVTTGNALKFAVRVTSAGKLQAYDNTGTLQLGSDSTAVISTGTLYRLDVKVGTGTSAAWELKLYNDPGPTVTPTLLDTLSGTGDLVATATTTIRLGKVTDRNGQSVDYYFDDIAISDSAYPGPHEVLFQAVTGNGSTMSWVDGTGASDWNEVKEVPPSDAEYVQSPTTGNPNIALFGFQTAAAVGISGVVNAVCLLTRYRENTTVGSATKLRTKSGATNSDTSTRNGSTIVAPCGQILVTDPDTSVAWTISGLDAAEGGIVEDNAVAIRGTFVGREVSFTQAVGGGAFTLTADPGSLAITGTAATLLVTRRLGADAGSLAITGTDANLLVVRRLSADPGAFAITGTAVDFELTTHADAGEVLITGTDAQLLVVAKLVADAGSVAITGTDAALLVTRRLAADTGAVLITGTDAAFPVTRTLTADPGAVSITGTDANFIITRVLTADAGAVVIAGTDASLLVTRTLAAAPGSFVITGTDATLTFQEDNTLSAESGAFVITGTPAALLVTRRIAADAGAFTITGQDADLRLATRLNAEAGAFTITGTAATLLVTRRIDAGAGAFTITGTDADLRLAAILSADAGSVTITGTDATFLATRRIVAQPGAFVITGTAAAFVLGGLVLPTPLPKNIATTAASGRTASTTAASRVVETV